AYAGAACARRSPSAWRCQCLRKGCGHRSDAQDEGLRGPKWSCRSRIRLRDRRSLLCEALAILRLRRVSARRLATADGFGVGSELARLLGARVTVLSRANLRMQPCYLSRARHRG